MQSFFISTRLRKAVFLIAALIAFAQSSSAQTTASHDVIMRIIGSNRLTVKPSELTAASTGSATMDSMTMDFQFSSLRGSEPKRMVVSVSGVVPSGVSLGLKENGTEDLQTRWSEINSVQASYGTTTIIGTRSGERAGKSAASLDFTVAMDDPEKKASASSGFIVITYTVI
jgi:hypothetical protein